MSQVIEQASKAIQARLDELEDERQRLERALTSLSASAPRRGRPKRKRSSGGGAKRAPRGQREKQLLASIRKNPSYKPADHARELGVNPNQIYALVSKLVKGGRVSKSKGGLQVEEA